jgi:hypothetical protein
MGHFVIPRGSAPVPKPTRPVVVAPRNNLDQLDDTLDDQGPDENHLRCLGR